MNSLKTYGVAVLLGSMALAGCAGLSNGIRVYPQKVYLFVDKTKNVSKILTLPDLKNSYQVQPWSFLSKHNFTIKIQEGQVTELGSDQDSSAALALLQKIVEVGAELAKASAEAAKAAAAAGKPVPMSTLHLLLGSRREFMNWTKRQVQACKSVMTRRRLWEASPLLLDLLVENGSSATFRIRDDFVTPVSID